MSGLPVNPFCRAARITFRRNRDKVMADFRKEACQALLHYRLIAFPPDCIPALRAAPTGLS
jgi:hypothetical protein